MSAAPLRATLWALEVQGARASPRELTELWRGGRLNRSTWLGATSGASVMGGKVLEQQGPSLRPPLLPRKNFKTFHCSATSTQKGAPVLSALLVEFSQSEMTVKQQPDPASEPASSQKPLLLLLPVTMPGPA